MIECWQLNEYIKNVYNTIAQCGVSVYNIIIRRNTNETKRPNKETSECWV